MISAIRALQHERQGNGGFDTTGAVYDPNHKFSLPEDVNSLQKKSFKCLQKNLHISVD